MQAKEKSLDQQVQFWALIGPFISLLTILVSMMRESPMQTPFAWTLIVSLPICWKWKLKGFAVSMGLLVVLFAYQFPELSPALQLWSGGVTIAAALSLLATALSYEEVSVLIGSVQVESKSRLDGMVNLDEKLKQANEAFCFERDQFRARVVELEKEEEILKTRVEASEKTAQVVREELATIHAKQEDLLQELYETRSRHHKTEQRACELQRFLDEGAGAKSSDIEELKSENCTLMEELLKYEETVSRLEVQMKSAVEEKEMLKDQCECLSKEQKTLLEMTHLSRRELEDSQKDQLELMAVIEKLEEKIKTTTFDKQDVLELEVARKQKLIDEQCMRIESLSVSISEKEQEIQLERCRNEEIIETSEEKELVLHKMIEGAKQEQEKLQNEVKELHQQVAAFEQEAVKLREECESLKQVKAPSKTEAAALRKAESRYKQLKDQFDEKSQGLDDTRRALFHMQERLFNMKRELDESKKVEKSQKEIVLEQNLKKMEEEHQKEINDLHEIIASLSCVTT